MRVEMADVEAPRIARSIWARHSRRAFVEVRVVDTSSIVRGKPPSPPSSDGAMVTAPTVELVLGVQGEVDADVLTSIPAAASRPHGHGTMSVALVGPRVQPFVDADVGGVADPRSSALTMRSRASAG